MRRLFLVRLYVIFIKMKALILSGGKGTRLRPLTSNLPKQLLPVANKPVIFYIIECLIKAGLSDIGIVINKGDVRIKSALVPNKWCIDFTFIEQESPKGLADAVKAAKPYIQDDEFLVWLGDTLIEEPIEHLIHAYKQNECHGAVLLGQTTQPEKCGIAEIKDNRILRVIEKPDDPPSNLALAGLYIFDSNIFQAIENIPPSQRGELELTDAIQYMIEWDVPVMPFITKAWWKDVGSIDDLHEANRYLLNKINSTE